MPQVGHVFIGDVKTPGEAQTEALDQQARQFTLQQAVEQRQAQIAKARDDQEYGQFLQQLSQTLTHDDGSPDYDRIVAEVSKRYPDRGLDLQERVIKQRKAAIDANALDFDTKKKTHDYDLDLVRRMTTPELFEALRPQIHDPYLAKALGTQFNPALLKQIGDAGLSESEKLAQQKQAIELYGKDPHLGFVTQMSLASNVDEIQDAIEGARLFLPAEAVQGYLQMLGNGTDMPQRAKALLASQQTPDAAPTGFTLSPGQKRFDAQGKEIAAVAPRPVATGSGGTTSQGDDVKLVAQAIVNGQQPPEMTGMYRNTLALKAELARQGYDLTKATEDWKATQKYLNTLNGAQQTRLRQAVNFTAESLDIIDELNAKWKGGRFPLLNKAQLTAAKNGLLGPDAQTIATQLDSQIADLVSELGTVYKGGNSSTDESLRLAAENLKSNWSQKTLQDAVALVRRNLTIRRNSILNTGAVAGKDNPYAPQTEKPAEAGGWVFDPATGKLVKKGG